MTTEDLWGKELPENALKDIYHFNVRGIQAYVHRMGRLGYY
jgi:hypothetical protein